MTSNLLETKSAIPENSVLGYSRPVKFKIEAVNVDGPFVLASIVEGSFFVVSSSSTLDGVPIRRELHEPNAGTFLFRLESTVGSEKLKVGSVVELYR